MGSRWAVAAALLVVVAGLAMLVAVDSLTRTSGDHGTSVRVPVNMPRGVRYETTVSE